MKQTHSGQPELEKKKKKKQRKYQYTKPEIGDQKKSEINMQKKVC